MAVPAIIAHTQANMEIQKMTTQQRIATLEHMYNSFTAKAKLADKAAVMAKIRALKATI